MALDIRFLIGSALMLGAIVVNTASGSSNMLIIFWMPSRKSTVP